VNRREFLAACAAAGFLAPKAHAHSPFPVKFRQQPAWAPLLQFTVPGSDDFPGEKIALETEAGLREALRSGRVPVATNCAGISPAPESYRDIAPGVSAAVFGTDKDIASGWRRWRESLGSVRYGRFYVLPGDILRYDIRSEKAGRLEHRIGVWKYTWASGAITRLQPLEETLTYGSQPWFRDITSYAFEGEPSFAEQMSRGVPYWRARLDPACGIDVYGENGIAAADIDGDGQDEIYVCQPGGLPNRLYKIDANGRFRDISRTAGLDFLDDTAAALFVDLRNSGSQDLVLVRSSMPFLFLNDGKGQFRPVSDAFRFVTRPQGSFTSVAAADFDRDGRLDLYFCCYVYYQSEAQYRYPVPYHDARNGPPNFLMRNRLDQNPGYFEDVTASTGIDQNNTHFSFAANWCDYNGDGWPDLYVTNDFGRKNLYRNDHGRFRDVAAEAGVVDLGPGMSAAWFDYDGDGSPDLLVSNMWSSCGQRIVNDPAFGPVVKDPSLKDAYRKHVKGNSLYRNNGDGTFTYTGDKQGIEICPWSWSCDGADFDNDGSPEIYVACGMVSNNSPADLMSYFYRQVVSKSPPKYDTAPDYENGWNAINQLIRQDYSWAGPEPNVFFGRRNGRYYDFSGVSGIDRAEDSRAFAIMDLDGDGNLDLVLRSRLGPQVRVFRNACTGSRKALVLALRGTKSNRDAIGARVDVDGQVKWVVAGSAYLSQHTKRLHFGLGDRDGADKLRIQWPSGDVQEFGPVRAGFLYEATEGVTQLRETPLKQKAPPPASGPVTADNRARLHTTWFREPVPLPDKRRGPALLFIHAGEPAPRVTAPVEGIDLRQAPEDVAASYAIFRRYLFDYRVDLETPLLLLVDGESRARKIYAEAPDSTTVAADIRSLGGPLPDARGLPFDGIYLGQPRRDYYKIGGALLMAGYPEQALPYLEEMVRINPENTKALFAIGRVHLQAKRLPQAREVLERAAALSPGMPEVWNELGGVETEAGNYAEALRLYEKALAIRPDSSYALVNVAQTQAKLGNTADAERSYRKLLESEPRNADATNGLGLLLAKQGRNDEARKLFEQAISNRRDDASAINNLGVLYVNMGQQDDAVAAFQYGIQVAPDDDMLYLNLARVFVGRGDRDRARTVMRQLLERKPGNAVATKALKALDAP
jgi:Flp pilus assembly protein TadD